MQNKTKKFQKLIFIHAITLENQGWSYLPFCVEENLNINISVGFVFEEKRFLYLTILWNIMG